MKSSVVIDGVTLTADQITRAWEDLQKKEEPSRVLQAGDLSFLGPRHFYATIRQGKELRQADLRTGVVLPFAVDLLPAERILGNAADILEAAGIGNNAKSS